MRFTIIKHNTKTYFELIPQSVSSWKRVTRNDNMRMNLVDFEQFGRFLRYQGENKHQTVFICVVNKYCALLCVCVYIYIMCSKRIWDVRLDRVRARCKTVRLPGWNDFPAHRVNGLERAHKLEHSQYLSLRESWVNVRPIYVVHVRMLSRCYSTLYFVAIYVYNTRRVKRATCTYIKEKFLVLFPLLS